ncbi:MAG: ABC transporter permease subunit [Alphaproteobacteria bacterium]|nr:ABC transporter permease subunit [Alphaproteobacteria bacterium]
MSYSLYVFLFTFKQAFFSVLLTVPLGILMARALVWNQGWKPTQFCLKLLGIPLITPALVSILGFITLAGYFFNVYSFTGILLAHLVFYSPFVALFMINSWHFIPEEHYRLSAQLHFSPWQIFALMEAPQLRKSMIEITWITFCLFLNSFTTIMILGGGPHHTTLSVALYQSLFFFYNPTQGLNFAGLQVFLSFCLAAGTTLFKSLPHGSSLKMPALPSLKSNFQKPLVIFSLFLILAPLMVVASFSFFSLSKTLSNPMLWHALSRSLLISGFMGPLCLLLTLALVKYETLFSKPLASLYLLLPPALLGVFLFCISLEWDFLPPEIFLFLMQLFIVLPFSFRLLKGPYQILQMTYHPTSHSLGLSSFQRFFLIEWPLLKKPLATALGLSLALSLGDFQSLAFFASPDIPGLSSLLYMQMGKYNFEESMGTALILLLLCYLLYQLPHWVLRTNVRT